MALLSSQIRSICSLNLSTQKSTAKIPLLLLMQRLNSHGIQPKSAPSSVGPHLVRIYHSASQNIDYLIRRPVYCFGHKGTSFPPSMANVSKHTQDIPRQHKIITYSLSANSQRPLAGAAHNAIFNTFRRTKDQFLYVVPPFVAAFLLMQWAENRNRFLNSKEGMKMQMKENA